MKMKIICYALVVTCIAVGSVTPANNSCTTPKPTGDIDWSRMGGKWIEAMKADHSNRNAQCFNYFDITPAEYGFSMQIEIAELGKSTIFTLYGILDKAEGTYYLSTDSNEAYRATVIADEDDASEAAIRHEEAKFKTHYGIFTDYETYLILAACNEESGWDFWIKMKNPAPTNAEIVKFVNILSDAGVCTRYYLQEDCALMGEDGL